MSYQNLILAGDKPSQDLDIHDLRCRGDFQVDGNLEFDNLDLVGDLTCVNVICTNVDCSDIVATKINTFATDGVEIVRGFAKVFGDEYSSATFLATVAVAPSAWSGLAVANDAAPYSGNFRVGTSDVIFEQAGVYSITYRVVSSTNFTAAQSAEVQFVNIPDPTAEGLSAYFNGNDNTGQVMSVSGNIIVKPANLNQSYKLNVLLAKGAGTLTCSGRMSIVRIK